MSRELVGEAWRYHGCGGGYPGVMVGTTMASITYDSSPET